MRHESSVPFRRARGASAVLGALLALAACKSTEPGAAAAGAPQKVEIQNEVTAKADVVMVDKATRGLLLRREDGAMMRMRVPAEVRNYDQIAAGNQLRVRFRQQLRVERNTTATGPADARLTAAAARAPKGDMPAAAAGAELSVVVQIESIDLSRDIVTFSLASGELVSHRIATDQGRNFVRGLKVGDKVTLAYSEALALSVEAL